jgi:hypothetical protein
MMVLPMLAVIRWITLPDLMQLNPKSTERYRPAVVSTNDRPSLQFRLVLGGALDYERFSAMDEKSQEA